MGCLILDSDPEARRLDKVSRRDDASSDQNEAKSSAFMQDQQVPKTRIPEP